MTPRKPSTGLGVSGPLPKVIKALADVIPTEGEMLDQAIDRGSRLLDRARLAESELAAERARVLQLDAALTELTKKHEQQINTTGSVGGEAAAAGEEKPWPQVGDVARLVSADSDITRSALRNEHLIGLAIGDEGTVSSLDDGCCDLLAGDGHTWTVATRDLRPSHCWCQRCRTGITGTGRRRFGA